MMNMVGHADLRTTLRYTVTDDDRQREITAGLLRLVRGEQGGRVQ